MHTDARRITRTTELGLLLALGALTIARCQTLPEAPKPHLDKTEWALLAADAGSRALDCYSTHQMLTRGYRELILPQAIADHAPVMALYSASAVAADSLIARRLSRGHRRLARIVTMIDLGQDLPWAIHNLYLEPRQKTLKPRQSQWNRKFPRALKIEL